MFEESLSLVKLAPANRQPQEMTSAADAAYKMIRNAIFAGELMVGDSLAERDLAERTGLSRTPIREAITRLRHDGLVVLERN